MIFRLFYHIFINFAGKSTGIVTNTRLTHATPAALYSHSSSRYWEDDSKVPQVSRKSCKDIARQLVEDDPGRHINVSVIMIRKIIFSNLKLIYFGNDSSISFIWRYKNVEGSIVNILRGLETWRNNPILFIEYFYSSERKKNDLFFISSTPLEQHST